MMTFEIFFSLSCLVLIGLSIPLMLGKIKPNGWYGFRIPLTMNHPEIWYPANRLAGWWLLGYAVLLLAASLLLPILPGMTLDAYTVILAVLALIGLLIVALVCWYYAKKLARSME